MAKESLFRSIIPTAGCMSCLYWIFGNYANIKISLIIGWVVIIGLIILGLKNKWFE